MEGSENGVSPSKSGKSATSPKPSFTGENNENDSCQVVVKNFMSPTISAASKAAVPRKKILVERNEISGYSGVHIQENFNLDHKRISRKSNSHSDRSSVQVVLPNNQASASDDDDSNTLAYSCSKHYDPLTNYLSPRPKYLRFNPERRHEIFTRLQNEGNGDLNISFGSQKINDEEESSTEDVRDSLVNAGKDEYNLVDDSKEQTEEEEEEEKEEEEEVEEDELEGERGWCLRGVIKILFTVIACLLSTSYICNMNSASTSPIQQAIWGLRDGYLTMQKQTLEAIPMRMHDPGFLAVDDGDFCHELNEVEVDENGEVENEESSDVQVVEDHEVNLDGQGDDLVQNDKEDDTDKIDKTEETKGVGAGEFEVKGGNFEEFLDTKTDEGSYRLEKEVEASNEGFNEDGADKMDTEKNEVVGRCEVESITDGFQHLTGATKDESKDAADSGLEKEANDSDDSEALGFSVEFNPTLEALGNSNGLSGTESSEELIGSHENSAISVHEVDEIGYNTEGETEKAGWIAPIIGVSAVFISLASLALFYRSKKLRSTFTEQSKCVKKATPSTMEEKAMPAPPAMEKKITFSSVNSLPISMEETPEKRDHDIHAPTAELIGEIFVGGISSSSHKVYGRKYQVIESEESKVTISAKQSSLTQPVLTPTRPSAPEFSGTSSVSHGSFTGERKISKKEGSSSGEAMTEITPLRRSSRLRNRAAVMSP